MEKKYTPEDEEKCPICAEPLKEGDIFAIDITEGTCHFECLDGCHCVDLDTGDEIEGGEIDKFTYGRE